MLATATTLDVVEAPIAIVPIGSIEQHGAHLPLDTDTAIAQAVAHGVARRTPRAWVLPAIAYGSSGEHQDFPGTTSIGAEALRLVILELSRSVRTWAERLLFINGHGGNAPVLDDVVAQLRREQHRVQWVGCALPHFDAHAGRSETSLMLHLAPDAVRMDRAERGETAPLRSLLPVLRERGVRAVSANGVLGDPWGASATEGERDLEIMVERVLMLGDGPTYGEK